MKEPRPWQASNIWGRSRSRAARHAVFCRGDGERLEQCHARLQLPWLPHDTYDRPSTAYFGVTLGLRVIASGRLITGEIADLPTGRLLPRLAQPPKVDPSKRFCEPSRLGLRSAHQGGSQFGRVALLRLIGRMVNASVEMGYDNFLLTIRRPLLRTLPWFPLVVAPPFEYPASEGGPLQIEPVWPATLNLHALVAAGRLLKPDGFEIMFPQPPSWVDPCQFPSPETLWRLFRRNRLETRRYPSDVTLGPPLAKLSPLT